MFAGLCSSQEPCLCVQQECTKPLWYKEQDTGNCRNDEVSAVAVHEPCLMTHLAFSVLDL